MKPITKKKHSKKLSLLLLKSVLLAAVFLGIITGLFQVIVDANESSIIIDKKSYDILAAIKAPATEIISTQDQEAGKKLLDGLLNIEGISFVRLTSSDGSYLKGVATKLFYSRYRVISDYLFEPTRTYSMQLQNNYQGRRLTGNISITIDTAYFGKSFIQRSTLVILSGIFRSLIMALILYFIYQMLLTRPLNNLIKRLSNINYENDKRIEIIPPKGYEHNEIGLWVDTANHLLGSIYDHYSMRREAEAQIATLSEYDYVTRLPNRVSIKKYLDKKINQLQKNNKKIAVLCLGIDSFKELNAHINFDAAEYILVQLSHRLQNILIKGCYLGKLGEDQFLIISDTIANPIEIAELAQKILKQLYQPFIIKNELITLKATAGISLFPEDGKNSEKLFQYAESAMIQAKSRNQNRYQFYLAKIDEKTREQKKIESELHYALERQQMLLLFQPLVNIVDHKIIGVEALLRWHHPTMGEIYPDVFIPILEKNLDIIPVGNWVLEQSFNTLRSWHDKGLTDLKISINLSVVQFQDEKLIARITELLKKYNLPSNKIELEVTESYILEDIDIAKDRLNQLKNLGINLAIDDFGTGYSSLSYLQKFPFDKIKIDKSFVDDLPTNKENSVIVNSIIQLCKNFNLTVLAEGVETSNQEQFLLEAGCDEGQGYLYGKPITNKEALKLICENKGYNL